MPSVREPICCKEIPNVLHFSHRAFQITPVLKAVCLNPHVLKTAYFTYRQQYQDLPETNGYSYFIYITLNLYIADLMEKNWELINYIKCSNYFNTQYMCRTTISGTLGHISTNSTTLENACKIIFQIHIILKTNNEISSKLLWKYTISNSSTSPLKNNKQKWDKS